MLSKFGFKKFSQLKENKNAYTSIRSDLDLCGIEHKFYMHHYTILNFWRVLTCTIIVIVLD